MLVSENEEYVELIKSTNWDAKIAVAKKRAYACTPIFAGLILAILFYSPVAGSLNQFEKSMFVGILSMATYYLNADVFRLKKIKAKQDAMK